MMSKSAYIILLVILFLLWGCQSNINIPISDKKPTLLVFCNNSDVSCFDLQFVSEYIDDTFGIDTVVRSYIFVDSALGEGVFNELQLNEIPSVVIFSSNKREVYRNEGTVDLEAISHHIQSLLQERR